MTEPSQSRADLARWMRALRPRIPESGTCPVCGTAWQGERLEGSTPRIYCTAQCARKASLRAWRQRQREK